MIKNNKTYQRLKGILGWSSVLIGFAYLTLVGIRHKETGNVLDLKVDIISPAGQKSIITSEEVASIITGYLGYDLLQAKVADLELDEFEEILQNDGRLEEVEVYIDAKSQLCVRLEEKKVVVRVMGKESSFYLDAKGGYVPTVKNRTIRVPIATGNIEEYNESFFKDKVPSHLLDIWSLAVKLQEDDFLKALIEQLDIDKNGKITMIPKVGREKIYLTGIDTDDKLRNLKIFYKDGLPKQGWSKYASLNLDIKGQVVAERIGNH